MTIAGLAIELKTDAIAFLDNQTEDPSTRHRRTVGNFWETAFQPLQVMPVRVEKERGTWMLGLEAEEDLQANAEILRAKGFWWPRSATPPSHAMLPPNKNDVYRRKIWGIASQVSPNLVYFVNASCPLALVNDYRNRIDRPNASLVHV